LPEATLALTTPNSLVTATACTFTYSDNISTVAALAGVATFNAGTRTFTFEYGGNDKTGAHAVEMTVATSAGSPLSTDAVVTNMAATYTVTITNGPCSTTSAITVTVAGAVSPQTYVLGAAATTIAYPTFTAHGSDGQTVCPLTYVAAPVVAIAAGVTIDNTAKTLVVSTGTVTFVSATAYSYVISVTGPDGTAVSTPTSTISLTISEPAVCLPPATVTATANTPAAHSFIVGSTTNLSITWARWTYTTAPLGTSCSLGYAAPVPTALTAAMVCTASTRTCVMTAASVTEAMVGAHTVTITATTSAGVAIPTQTSVLTVLTIASACSTLATATAPATAA